MATKIHDGSLVPASDLLSNYAEDDDGNKLKFEQVEGAAYPTFEAKSDVPDNSGRTRVYRFSFDDTNVTVHMTLSTPDVKGQKQTATGKSVKEVHIANEGNAADSKKKQRTTATKAAKTKSARLSNPKQQKSSLIPKKRKQKITVVKRRFLN